MLKFFRKIRHQLVADNQGSKYIIYAFGEVILVVIGILIALQINNWNETRKNNEEESIILTNLQKEFVKNQLDLEVMIVTHQYLAESNREFAELFSPDPPKISLQKLDSLMDGVAYIPEYKPVVNILETVTSSGKLAIIKDEELKYLISSWSSQLEDYRMTAKFGYDYYFNYIYQFMSEHYQLKNLGIDKGFGEVAPSEFEVNIEFVLSNSVFENHVEMRRANAEFALSHARKLFDLQQQIIERIGGQIAGLEQ